MKGAETKTKITNKILEVFPNAFLYNSGKEIRIPDIEDGEEVQIKVVLTASKVCVSAEDENALPQANKKIVSDTSTNNSAFGNEEKEIVTPTQEEKENVKNLLASLGL